MRASAEGGGRFFDLAVHCLDLAAWVFGTIEHVLDVESPVGPCSAAETTSTGVKGPPPPAAA
jgi:predicted dehydrogenase